MSEDVKAQIDSLVRGHPVLLFMKGNRESPQCGFSSTVVRILDTLIPVLGGCHKPLTARQ